MNKNNINVTKLDIITTIADTLGIPEEKINPSDTPRTIPEWDSLTQLKISSALEHLINKSFSFDEMLEISTINGWVNLCLRKINEPPL